MIEVLWIVIFVFFGIGFIGAFIRLAKGPHLPDRVLALDLISILAVGLFIVYAIRFTQTSFLDVAIILALINFLGTIAFAYYIERRT